MLWLRKPNWNNILSDKCPQCNVLLKKKTDEQNPLFGCDCGFLVRYLRLISLKEEMRKKIVVKNTSIKMLLKVL